MGIDSLGCMEQGLNRLGWLQEPIADVVGVNQQRVSQITNNTIFSEIGNTVPLSFQGCQGSSNFLIAALERGKGYCWGFV